MEGNLDDEMYLTNDSGITEDEPASLEEGLLYVMKVDVWHLASWLSTVREKYTGGSGF